MSKVLAIVAIVVLASLLIFGTLSHTFDGSGVGDTRTVERISLSQDRLMVELSFVGGSEYDRDNPCSMDYKARGTWLEDVLEVEVVVTKGMGHGRPFGSRACNPVGYGREVELELDEPFNGSEIRDPNSGRSLLFKPPDGLAELSDLPDGWMLRVQSGASLIRAGGWIRVYSPGGDPSRELVLVQAFGDEARVRTEYTSEPPPRIDIGAHRGEVRIRKSGEQVLLWRQGGDGFALFAFEDVFSLDELVALAESVTS